MKNYKDRIDKLLEENYGHMGEFHQAVHDVSEDVLSYIATKDQDTEHLFRVLMFLIEPDRQITFRVTWHDDNNRTQINRGFRVQHSNALGPYKGGLRLSDNVNLSVLQFLGFEQTFKNALTGLPMGGAKGGADFDPRGKTDGEIERFCRAFMTQLSRYIGVEKDIPAGDMGVGVREIGYMFDQYKSVTGNFSGVITGKAPVFGGSCIREEATGYGCVYFAEQVIQHDDRKLAGMRCAISGAGNVSLFTAEKLLRKDANVISLSDRSGFIYFKDGLTLDQLDAVKAYKKEKGSLEELADERDWKFIGNGAKPWCLNGDVAFACATQNEIEEVDACKLVDGGYKYLFEGANMPCTSAAVKRIQKSGITLGPSKAVNAGGVAVSGLEISQNQTRRYWDADKVDDELQQIMIRIFETCRNNGSSIDSDKINYKAGANIASFKELANALYYFGVN